MDLLGAYENIIMEGFVPADVNKTIRVMIKECNDGVLIYDRCGSVVKGYSEGDQIPLQINFLDGRKELQLIGIFHRAGNIYHISKMPIFELQDERMTSPLFDVATTASRYASLAFNGRITSESTIGARISEDSIRRIAREVFEEMRREEM